DLYRLVARFVSANTDRLFDRKQEYLAVADLAGFGRAHDCAHGFVGDLVAYHDLHFHLGQEIDGIFASAVNLGVAFLAAEPFDLPPRHALHAHFGERVLHFLEFERLDDGFDFFHASERINGWSVCAWPDTLRTLAARMPVEELTCSPEGGNSPRLLHCAKAD